MLSRFRLRSKLFSPKKIVRNTSYKLYKEEARALIHDRLNYYNRNSDFSFNRVSIKDQKRSWGSCSSKANLNFSYKLLFLPSCLSDYIVVHELCHLRFMNHKMEFWQEVEKILPDYKNRMMTLRALERTTGTSIKALLAYKKIHNCEACAGGKTAPEMI